MAEFVWRKQDVDKRREHLNGKIEELSRLKPEVPRVRLLLGMIVDGPVIESEYQDLDRFILILRCLIEHRRSPELRDLEITKLVELARTILLHSGIKPKTSKLSYLYENLYLVLSQIDGDRNRTWDAAWNQTMSKFFSEYGREQASSKQLLASAIRGFRLGFTESALGFLNQLIALPQAESRERAHAAVLKCRLLRLCGRVVEFNQVYADLFDCCASHPDFRLEMEWEKALFDSIGEAKDMVALARCISKGQKFYSPLYLLEGQLLIRTLGDKRAISKLEKLQTVENRRDFSLKEIGVLYTAAVSLEQCHDVEIPLPSRLMTLGAVISKLSSETSIYTQLIIFAAAARWLYRTRLDEFEVLCREEYRAINLRLTDGKNADPLGLLVQRGEQAESPTVSALSPGLVRSTG